MVRHGGDVANIIPAHTRTDCGWRALARWASSRSSSRACDRCFEAGALATGAALEIEPVAPDYTQMEHDAGTRRGVPPQRATTSGGPIHSTTAMTFSTDMGNVSLAMPSIHPCIGIESDGAVNHQPDVRSRVHQRVGRPRGARRFARDGVERDRDRFAGRCATGCCA